MEVWERDGKALGEEHTMRLPLRLDHDSFMIGYWIGCAIGVAVGAILF